MKSEEDLEDSPTDCEGAAPGGPGRLATLATLPAPGRGALALLLLWAVLAGVAFGPMLSFDPEPSLVTEVEGVFFTPSDTSPTVVLLLAAWLLYRRWDRLKRLPLVRGPAWLCTGLLGLAGGVLAWSTYVGARDLRTVALILTLQGLGCLFGGLRAMRLLAVPTAFLVFAVPMPAPLLNVLLSHMQYWTADFTGLLLHGIGQTAFVAGDEIVLVDNVFAIIETCSGVRITETLTILTILMLDLFRRRGLHAAILLLIAPAVAFLCNGARAVAIILNPHSNIAEIHTLQGVGMLLGGLLLLYAIDGLLDRVLSWHASAAAADPTPLIASGPPVGRRSVASATGVLALFAGITLLLPSWPVYPLVPIPHLVRNLEQLPGWSSGELKPDYRYLGRIGIQRDLSRRYRQQGEAVDLYLGVGNRAVRPRSVLFAKILLPGRGRYSESEGPIDLGPAASAATWRVAATKSHRFLVISWQEAAGSLAAETLRSFLGLGRSPLRGVGEPLAVRISTQIEAPDPESRARAEARLLAFYGALRPELDALHGVLRGDTF